MFSKVPTLTLTLARSLYLPALNSVCVCVSPVFFFRHTSLFQYVHTLVFYAVCGCSLISYCCCCSFVTHAHCTFSLILIYVCMLFFSPLIHTLTHSLTEYSFTLCCFTHMLTCYIHTTRSQQHNTHTKRHNIAC